MDRISVNNLCKPYFDDLVAYLYEELGDEASERLESHLAECSDCTDEFAGLSLARLGVYEWNRDEFAHLATPRIVVPFEQKSEPKLSWTAKYLQPLFSAPKFAAAGLSFAIILTAGIIFSAVLTPGTTDVAEVSPVATPSTVEKAVVLKAEIIKEPLTVAETYTSINNRDSSTGRKKDLSQSQKQIQSPVLRNKVRKPAATLEASNVPNQRAPRLNNFEDEDDATLRLADLLAESDIESR